MIAVSLDVGTDNEALLNDPLYLGNRHSRVRGERYDELIAAYVEAATKLFPNALLHFEDFGASNARRILDQYRERARIFNDDIQGTGAITVAAILAGIRIARTRPSEQRVVIFGAGTAGMGIADQIRTIMVHDGLSHDEATRHFWAVDKQGLLVRRHAATCGTSSSRMRGRASEVAGWGSTDLGRRCGERAPDDPGRNIDRRRRLHRAGRSARWPSTSSGR